VGLSPGLDAEVLVVGAGISGIGAAIALKERGFTEVILLEGADELGGTWRDNRYLGVAVDIPSASYCFSYETDFPWSRAFAPGSEILAYIRHCAEAHGVLGQIRTGARVSEARFDASDDTWAVSLDGGETLRCRYLVAATGLFGAPIIPDFPGLDRFAGPVWHSSRWDHEVELSGRRVGIVGTGASAVQIVPELAERAGHLTVFQRTPIYVGPRFDHALAPGSPWSPRRWAPVRAGLRLLSEASLDFLTFSIVNYRRLPWFVRAVGWLVRRHMARQIADPALAERLVPTYGLGCKRPATSNTYLPTFNRDDVRLVSDPIDHIEEGGVITASGERLELDVLVLATGFQTTEQGNGPSFAVHGTGGLELGQFWEDHRLQATAGVAVPGFPNFFLTAGPYAGGFNWFPMLEAHVGLIGACLDTARSRGHTRVEVDPQAHAAYMAHMWSRAEGTVFLAPACAGANSYYQDRHGDASLPLPHTPWWRAWRNRRVGVQDFRFGPSGDSPAS